VTYCDIISSMALKAISGGAEDMSERTHSRIRRFVPVENIQDFPVIAFHSPRKENSPQKSASRENDTSLGPARRKKKFPGKGVSGVKKNPKGGSR